VPGCMGSPGAAEPRQRRSNAAEFVALHTDDALAFCRKSAGFNPACPRAKQLPTGMARRNRDVLFYCCMHASTRRQCGGCCARGKTALSRHPPSLSMRALPEALPLNTKGREYDGETLGHSPVTLQTSKSYSRTLEMAKKREDFSHAIACVLVLAVLHEVRYVTCHNMM
jgi:hypothetical protein